MNRPSILTQLNLISRARWWMTVVPNIPILTGAYLISVQFQTHALIAGSQLPNTADAVVVFAAMIVSVFLSEIVTRAITGKARSARIQFITLMTATLLSAGTFLVAIPRIPSSQVLFYFAASLALGAFVILLRARLIRGHRHEALIHSGAQLWQKRTLVTLWTRNNVRSRYAQAVLGIIWVVLLPLAQAVIMAFVFSQLVRIPVGDVPFVSFYLAALVPWTFINNGVNQGAVSILGQMPLINQVYFPREILPLVKLGELAVDALFTFVALIVVNAIVGIYPNLNWIFLPLLTGIALLGTFGIVLFLSVLTVFIRDIPQLVFVSMQLLFYLSPIIYPVSFIPEQLRWIVMLNPLVPLIQGYRDVLVFNVPVDIVSLFYPLVFSVAVFYVGFAFFKANERRLTDYI